jgi:hypothetical protein
MAHASISTPRPYKVVDDKVLDADLTGGEPRFMIYEQPEHMRTRSTNDEGTA